MRHNRQCHSCLEPLAVRANNVKKRDYFTKYGEQARTVLQVLLDKYANLGIEAIEKMDVLRVQPLD